MTNEEMIKRLSAFITCLKCETSGKECDLNCATQYEAGNMGELIEMFETIVEKLEAGSWIPCSERLPSDRERKEWIDKNLDGIGYLYPCLVTRYSSINPERTKNNPYVAKHYFDGEDFVNNGEEVCSEYIIAWMPLPEPFKEAEHDE